MTTLRCPQCHQKIPPNTIVCGCCGTYLVSLPEPQARVERLGGATTSRSCTGCYQPIDPGATRCAHCGMASASITQPLARRNTNATDITELCPYCEQPRRAEVRFCRHCGYNFSGLVPDQRRASDPASRLQIGIGRVLNQKYRLIKPLAVGGMGIIHLAEDLILKRRVVIKSLLTGDDPELIAQSVKEREFLATIKHANIVSIYDFFMAENRGYIVMEYVQGMTLYQLMADQERVLAVPDAIRYILSILPAFSYFAKLRLAYCDFKAENLMVEVLKDGSQMVKLIDLGTVIKWTAHPEAVYGTKGFYAPEATHAPSPITDLYSICRTLAWLVSWMDLDDPPFGMPPIERYPVFQAYPMLYRLLVKGTHPNPARRFRSAEELGAQLAGVLRMIVGGDPDGRTPSQFFLSPTLTTPGQPSLHDQAALDQADPAIELLQFGDTALYDGNLAHAFDWYRQAVEFNPSSLDGQLRLAAALTEQAAFPAAQATIDEARRRSPGHWKVSWYIGKLCEARGHLRAAADHYTTVMNDLPGELPPQQALARLYARQGDVHAAVQLYRYVIQADPGNAEAIVGLAHALIGLQHWDEAAAALGSIPESSAKYVDAQLLRCEVFLTYITPLTPENLVQATQAVHALSGRTEAPSYYLARGNVYRAAQQLSRKRQLPADLVLPGVPDTSERTLGLIAETSYMEYLQRTAQPAHREEILRRRFEVAPWRLW